MQENRLSKTNRMLTCECGHTFYIDYLYAERNPSRFNHKPYRMYCTKCKNFVYFDKDDGVDDLNVLLEQKRKLIKQKLINKVNDDSEIEKPKSKVTFNDIDMDRTFKEWENLWSIQMGY